MTRISVFCTSRLDLLCLTAWQLIVPDCLSDGHVSASWGSAQQRPPAARSAILFSFCDKESQRFPAKKQFIPASNLGVFRLYPILIAL